MSRSAGKRTTFAALLVVGALLIPASQAAAGAHIASGGGPIATQSGALINYVSTARVKVGKRMEVPLVCSANCNVTSTIVIKGPSTKIKSTVAGALVANIPGGHFIKPNGPLLKLMKADTKRFRFVNNVTATDPVTGVQDHISHVFKLKR
jgi:hypothetical protein